VKEGVTAIAALTFRRRCTLAGIITSVTTYHRPWLHTDAELEDATGSLLLRFSGRPGIPGLRPGQRVVVDGTPARVGRTAVILNPRYAFLTGGTSR
jgi:hypothetical protein